MDTRLIVPLTHVCRYWRNCITSDPANWTRISNLSKELTILTLERAKASPLQVSFMGEGCTSPCVPVPYIQNIGTLSFIDLITIEALRQALPGFPQSTPNLRSLKLRQARRAVLDRSIDPFELLTPTLGHLELFGVPLYPSILRLRSLTRLPMRASGWTSTWAPSWVFWRRTTRSTVWI